jgi:hypothetical protein
LASSPLRTLPSATPAVAPTAGTAPLTITPATHTCVGGPVPWPQRDLHLCPPPLLCTMCAIPASPAHPPLTLSVSAVFPIPIVELQSLPNLAIGPRPRSTLITHYLGSTTPKQRSSFVGGDIWLLVNNNE